MKKNWLAIATIICALFIVFLADSGNMPRFIKQLYDFPNGDKAGHFFLMGLLSYVLNRTALVSRVATQETVQSELDLNLPRVIWTVSLMLAFFVTLEEVSQQLFPRRTFSFTDLVFSYAGIVFFAWLAVRRQK